MFGAFADIVAVILVALSIWIGGAGGTFVFWLGQWWAAMAPLSTAYVLWTERRMLWRQYRARGRRKRLERGEFAT